MKTYYKISPIIPKQHRDITETLLKYLWDTTVTKPKQDRNITKASPWHGDIAETPPKRHWNISTALRKRDRDITMTPPKQHRDVTKTLSRHLRDISKALQNKAATPPWHPETSPSNAIPRPTHHGDKTDTRPRAWIFQSWSFLRRHTGHSYTDLPKGAQYTNSKWNFGFCLGSRSNQNIHQCSSPNNQKTITKAKNNTSIDPKQCK